ncbi:MAG: hypothetical protein WC661_09480 [Opitutaceae bacterium]
MTLNKKNGKLAGLIALAMGLSSAISAQAAPATGAPATGVPAPAAKIIVQDDFLGTRENWSWYGEIAKGEFVLTSPSPAQYAGAQTLLNPPVQLPPAGGDAVRIRLKIMGISDAGASGKIASEARLFLVPAPLKNPTFADPYSNPSALTVLLGVNGDQQTMQISLFQKTDQTTAGYGTPLYSVRLPLNSFPLTLDWWLARNAYKLDVTPKGQTIDGSRQGVLALGDVWAGDLCYVMRAVNIGAGIRTQLRISEFSITTAPLPAE